MNEDTANQITTGVVVKPTPKRKSKTPKPRAPRVIPPEEQAIRDAAKAQIEAYRQGLKSSGILQRIQALVPRLTREHVRTLISQLDEAERRATTKEIV